MTRQVALGAVVAFIVTVVALSVCQPRADQVAVAPTPAPAPAPPPPALTKTGAPVMNDVVMARPMLMKDAVARPAFLQKALAPDAGAP